MERIAEGFGLVEGPWWDPHTATLAFADTVGGGVWRARGDGAVEEVVVGRRGIGGIVGHVDGGFVVTGKDVSWRAGGRAITLLEASADSPLTRFNDLCADAAGRVYVGNHGFTIEHERDGTRPTDGVIAAIEPDGETRVVARGISVANGLTPSPDGRHLHVVDSGHRTLLSYAVRSDGTLRDRRVVARWDDGRPDGIAVDAAGTIWVALAGAAAIAGCTPQGEPAGRIDVPDSYPTSVCFGGDDLRDLFVTTAGDGAYLEGGRRGAVYRVEVEVPGIPVAAARTRPTFKIS